MSKSTGNVIDPIHVIEGASLEQLAVSLSRNLSPAQVEEYRRRQFVALILLSRTNSNLKVDLPEGIPECGTDALRFSLVSYIHSQVNTTFVVFP